MTDDPSRAALDEFLGTPPESPWRRRAMWAGVAILFVGLAFALVRCFGASDEGLYVTEEVRRGDLAVTVSATGNVAPTNQVEVGSEVSGTIEQVLVDFNDEVTKGQTLAVLDTDIIDDTIRQSEAVLGARQAAVGQARATVSEAEAQLRRLREVERLSGGKVPSKTEMETAIATRDRAVASLAAAEADVVAAQANLASNVTQRTKATIRAPVTGVVLSRQIEPGQTVAASFNTPTLFIIAEDLNSMQLEVAIDEADVGRIEDGQQATFTVDAYPGETFRAQIKRVNVGANSIGSSTSASSGAASSTGTSTVVAYDAILTVDNSTGMLRPGMTATAEISVQSAKNSLLVPNSAFRFSPNQPSAEAQSGGIMSSMAPRPPRRRSGQAQEREIGAGSRQTVYVLEKGRPKPVEVTTGPTDGRFTVVTSGQLKPGAQVITGQRAVPQ